MNVKSESRFYPSSKSFFMLLPVIAFYLFVAYNSSGYLQEDEHYQIVEFANYKLGLVPESKLAWEFNARVRPGFQPLICYAIFKTAQLLNINDGYNLTFLLRAFTALLSIYVITMFVNSYKKYIASSLRLPFVIASYLLWFLPYVNVRFSSENLSGLMLILALSLFEKWRCGKNFRMIFFTGIVLGCAVLFRYQSLLVIVGIVCWLVFIKKSKYVAILYLALGVTIVMLLGVLIDYWLYNSWALTAYNYFDINILKGVASNFGVEPFYQYVVYAVKAPGVLGIIILLSFIVVIIYYSKSLIVWVCVPFIIVHSFIPHKEARFLYPLINLCPIIMMLGFQKVSSLLFKTENINTKTLRSKVILCVFIIINIAGLFAISTTSAAAGKFSAGEYIHRHYNKEQLRIVVIGDAFPFIDWGTIQNTYYSSKGYNVRKAVNIWQKEIYQAKNDDYKNIFIIKANELAGPKELAYLKSMHFQKVYQSIPDLSLFLYNFYSADLKSQQTYIFERTY